MNLLRNSLKGIVIPSEARNLLSEETSKVSRCEANVCNASDKHNGRDTFSNWSIPMKPLRYFVIAILVLGFSLTSRAVYLHAKAELASVLIHRAWQESVHTGKSRSPWPGADYHPVARLRIPRLGYDEIILDSATPRSLAFGPARLLSGAAFGEPGNLEIAGHRDSWFLPLKSIAIGDIIELQWFDTHTSQLRTRTYKVQSLDVVEPADTSLLAPTATDALTLITCYPFGSSPHSPQRFLVRASPQI